MDHLWFDSSHWLLYVTHIRITCIPGIIDFCISGFFKVTLQNLDCVSDSVLSVYVWFSIEMYACFSVLARKWIWISVIYSDKINLPKNMDAVWFVQYLHVLHTHTHTHTYTHKHTHTHTHHSKAKKICLCSDVPNTCHPPILIKRSDPCA